MEEQEKKTQRGTKSSTSKSSATKTTQKATKKITATTTEKKPKANKTTTSATTKKRVATKKEEKEIKPVVEETKKVERKPRTTSARTSKVSEDKAKTSKVVLEEIKVTKKKNTVKKSNPKEENEEVKNNKETEKVVSNKESKIIEEPKEVKVEKEKAKEANTKKYIEISIGGIIAVLFIGVLIFFNVSLGKKAYNMTKGNNTIQNEIVNTDIEIEEEPIGIVINKQNEIVTKLIEKIEFPINTTASIYQIGEFDTDTITNDLKLRIGWANLKDEDKFHAKQATGESIIVVEKKAMEESINETLGNLVKYKDASFSNTNVKDFSRNAETKGIIKYEEESYTATENENKEENKLAFIYQEVQKVLRYDNEIVIVIKAAFVNQEEDKYVIYQNYNDSFENKLLETTYDNLFENTEFNKMTGKCSIAITENKSLEEIREELNTYKYTFTKDDSTGEYYLKEFKKENSNM